MSKKKTKQKTKTKDDKPATPPPEFDEGKPTTPPPEFEGSFTTNAINN